MPSKIPWPVNHGHREPSRVISLRIGPYSIAVRYVFDRNKATAGTDDLLFLITDAIWLAIDGRRAG